MKEKILMLIIGVLVGAIISTLGFYCYSKINSTQKCMPDGNMPQMMQQQNGNSTNGNSTNKGTPPDLPSNNQNNENNTNGGTPPEKPSGDNTESPQGTPNQNNNG